MQGPAAFVKSCVSLRGLGIAAALVAVLALVVHFGVVPIYREITGFIPFDMQARLSQVMIGVELGAFNKAAAADIYLLFIGVDALYAAATAWLFTLLWLWVFAIAPNRLFAFLTRGGIVMVPFYVWALDIVAKVGFFRLVRGLEGPAYAEVVDFSVMVHRLHFALMDLRNYATIAFVLAVFAAALWRRRAA